MILEKAYFLHKINMFRLYEYGIHNGRNYVSSIR